MSTGCVSVLMPRLTVLDAERCFPALRPAVVHLSMVHLSSINARSPRCDISVRSVGISMKLGRNIRHASGIAEKVFKVGVKIHGHDQNS